MLNILVTGSNGQLARCIRDIVHQENHFNFIFKNSTDLDITNSEKVTSFFEEHEIAFCVNCAAYTAVDKAESEKEIALSVNEMGAKNLAIECSRKSAKLIHISTDFVFDGSKSVAYLESDETNPKSVYGFSKLKGEFEIQNHLSKHFIIRTSWLYSEHGNNFFKTMLKLSNERESLSVVCDQIGTPTYAKDLAEVILKIIKTNNNNYGLFHFSNEGVASWYDFAHAIFDENQKEIKLTPIKTSDYPTPAKRPPFSVMDKNKVKECFEIEIPHWRDSLKKAIFNLNNIGK
jgi:dTDP-4-dehydrorhamnose reductase